MSLRDYTVKAFLWMKRRFSGGLRTLKLYNPLNGLHLSRGPCQFERPYKEVKSSQLLLRYYITVTFKKILLVGFSNPGPMSRMYGTIEGHPRNRAHFPSWQWPGFYSSQPRFHSCQMLYCFYLGP